MKRKGKGWPMYATCVLWGVPAGNTGLSKHSHPVFPPLPPCENNSKAPKFAETAPTPPPPCNSHALVQATIGVGTALIWDFCTAITGGGGTVVPTRVFLARGGGFI